MKNLIKELTDEHTGLILCKPSGTSGGTFSTQSDPQYYVRMGIRSISKVLDERGFDYSWIKETSIAKGLDWYQRNFFHDLSRYWLVLSREALDVLKEHEKHLGEVGEILPKQ